MKFKVVIIALVALFAVSCSTITPSPDFTVTYLSIVGSGVGATTTTVLGPDVEIENNSTVETIIYIATCQYLKDGNIIYESEDDYLSLNVLLPATITVDGSIARGKTEITGMWFPFPTEVWDMMVDNDWDGVTLRVFLTGRDNYGYNKTFTTSFDFGCLRY